MGGGSGTGTGTGSGPGRGSGLGDGEGGGTGGGAYQIGNGVLPPELIHRTSPQYTAEAMRAKIQGVSLLSGIVGVDGTLHGHPHLPLARRHVRAGPGSDQVRPAVALPSGHQAGPRRPGLRDDRSRLQPPLIGAAST